MVTASHNPGSYIGLKLMAPKLFPLADGCGPEGGIAKIREIYLSEESIIEEEKGECKTINYLDDFISYNPIPKNNIEKCNITEIAPNV